MRGLSRVGFIVLFGASTFAACIRPVSDKGDAICEPGENIFCRCPGGDAGTKTCRPDGMSFEPCTTRVGACPSIGPDAMSSSSTSQSSSSGGGEGGGGGASGAGGGAPATRKLYERCSKDAECESNLCAMGYCSQQCFTYQDCQVPKGDCIRVGEVAVCLRTCSYTLECIGQFGDPSRCGFVHAVDDVPNTVCAYWDPEPALPPPGADCFNDLACNLGNLHRSLVCDADKCAAGCHANDDCPVGQSCSSQDGKTLGTCG